MSEIAIQNLFLKLVRAVDFDFPCRQVGAGERSAIANALVPIQAKGLYLPFDHSMISRLLSVSIFVNW